VTLVVYSGSGGGPPDLQEVYGELPMDKKELLPMGPGQVAVLDVEAPACSLAGVGKRQTGCVIQPDGTDTPSDRGWVGEGAGGMRRLDGSGAEVLRQGRKRGP
jgi:hypothetical protein